MIYFNERQILLNRLYLARKYSKASLTACGSVVLKLTPSSWITWNQKKKPKYIKGGNTSGFVWACALPHQYYSNIALVEGVFDAMAIAECYHSTLPVCTFGCNVTKEQAINISNIAAEHETMYIDSWYDDDDAGNKGTTKLISLLPIDKCIRIMGYKDPYDAYFNDALINQNIITEPISNYIKTIPTNELYNMARNTDDIRIIKEWYGRV